jgi:ribonuclease HI
MLAKRKLLHYFEAHPIQVVNSSGLEEVVGNRNTKIRVVKWVAELMGLDITYIPRSVIKSQALVDFVVDWTDAQVAPESEPPKHWEMYFDGSFTLNGAGGGVVLVSPSGDRLQYVLCIYFRATNNTTEYETLLHGLQVAAELGVKRLQVRGESVLVVNQVLKEPSSRDLRMTAYCLEVRKLEDKFEGLDIHHVLCKDNEAADALARITSARDPSRRGYLPPTYNSHPSD